MRNYTKFWVLLLVVFCGGVHASMQSPQDLIETTANQVLEKLTNEKALISKEPERVYDLVNEFILPHFDFERMSKWVLGKYWRRTNAEQKVRFVEEFRTLLVRTYASSLAEYTDKKINYLPFRDDVSSGDVTVRSEIDQPGGFPIPINYRLQKNGETWKVYDVTIDDISLVANYRSSFSKEIRNAGIDKLISTLADRNKQHAP